MSNFDIMVGILEDNKIPYRIITDLAILMRESKGQLNPASNPKGVEVNGIVFVNYWSIIDYLQKNGLVRC